MCGPGAFHHRMNKPALQLQPMITLLLQVSDRVLAKKFRTDVLPGRFARQRFNAVLAKLEQMSIAIGTWPGAALAIESVLLVDLEPISNTARETGLARGEFQTLHQSVHSRRDPIGRTQSRLRLFLRRLGSGSWNSGRIVRGVVRFTRWRARSNSARPLRYGFVLRAGLG